MPRQRRSPVAMVLPDCARAGAPRPSARLHTLPTGGGALGSFSVDANGCRMQVEDGSGKVTWTSPTHAAGCVWVFGGLIIGPINAPDEPTGSSGSIRVYESNNRLVWTNGVNACRPVSLGMLGNGIAGSTDCNGKVVWAVPPQSPPGMFRALVCRSLCCCGAAWSSGAACRTSSPAANRQAGCTCAQRK